MHQSSSITDKTYQKLVIQVSLNGLSFACFDTLTKTPISVQDIHFDSFQKNIKTEELFAQTFSDYPELNKRYDEVLVLHSNNLSTFVPVALFDEEYLASYLQFNTKVFNTDFFTYDELEKYQMNNIYIPYINMNNFFIDKFGTFEYKHSSTILVNKLLDLSKNIEDKKMYVHLNRSHFEIIVIQNQNLILYNTFEYKTPYDFIYYILFTAEQLHLNPENFTLELLGNITESDSFFEIAFNYIRNVNLMKMDYLVNSLSETENRQHFILLNT